MEEFDPRRLSYPAKMLRPENEDWLRKARLRALGAFLRQAKQDESELRAYEKAQRAIGRVERVMLSTLGSRGELANAAYGAPAIDYQAMLEQGTIFERVHDSPHKFHTRFTAESAYMRVRQIDDREERKKGRRIRAARGLHDAPTLFRVNTQDSLPKEKSKRRVIDARPSWLSNAKLSSTGR